MAHRASCTFQLFQRQTLPRLAVRAGVDRIGRFPVAEAVSQHTRNGLLAGTVSTQHLANEGFKGHQGREHRASGRGGMGNNRADAIGRKKVVEWQVVGLQK